MLPRIIEGDDKDKEGWISANLVEMTKESKAIKANRDAADAQRRKEAEAERKKKQAAKDAARGRRGSGPG